MINLLAIIKTRQKIIISKLIILNNFIIYLESKFELLSFKYTNIQSFLSKHN
jgi:hypothetical protein